MNKKPSFKDILFKSKTEDLYIELNNYNYFHSPSSLHDQDPRLIGREREENELRRILLSSDTPSGTYLVTGFRGIGKTSLVAQVLSKIKGRPIFSFSRAVLIFIFAAISVLFSFYNSGVFVFCLLTSNIIAFSYLVRQFLMKDYIKISTLFKAIGRYRSFNNDFSDYSQLLIKISITSVFLWLINSQNELTLRSLTFYFFIYLLIFILLSAFKTIYNEIKCAGYKRTINSINHTLRYFGNLVSTTVRGSNLNCIHLNLGKDDINEKDVMKQILQSLHNNYGDNTKLFNLNRLLWVFMLGFAIVVLQFFYYYKPVFKGVQNIRQSINLYEYLPSQKIFTLHSPDLKAIDSTLSLIGNVTQFREQIDTLIFNDSIINGTDNGDNPYFEPLTGSSLAKELLNEVDFMFFNVYQRFRNRLNFLIITDDTTPTRIKLEFDTGNKITSRYYFVIPHFPDYFQALYIIFLIMVIGYAGHYKWFGINTNAYIFRRIKLLKERLDSEVMVQKSNATNVKGKQFLGISWSRQRSNRYPLADYGIIEAELINIFKEIAKIPVFLSRPRFIFIFDELDKIEPYANQNLMDKEAAQNEDPIEPSTSYASTESHRNRQQMVSKLLASLKFFFNTVEAKFIFIAGREMFDASLADTSDRESFIGSIFNKVIYINSFYTDDSDDKPTDITSMTEAYVCQYLENEYKNRYATLENYYELLKSKLKVRLHNETFPLGLTENDFDNHGDFKLYIEFKNKLYVKVLYTLQNFITYLTYRSNGSPKKITQLFEECISDSRDPNMKYAMVVGKRFNRFSGLDREAWINRPQGLYLKFTENDQYKFALTASLFTPFINSRGRYLKRLGDKLLVSTSFLIDHLYKYHKSAFSWQNLELTPEIIAINKAPELRDFIENIVRYLNKTNFREIISGIHDFKFQNRIRGEINYISKISEMEAAAFNFTLDESLQIKRHYQKKLLEERDTSAKYNLNIQEQYIHTTGMYNMIIGDLYFYDEEFDEAIRYYKNSIQELRYIVTDRSLEKQIYLLSLYLKNSMKLALAFEKQNSFDRAYATYNRISHETIRNRDVDINRLYGVKEMKLRCEDIGGFMHEMIDPSVVINGFAFNNSTKGLGDEIDELIDAPGFGLGLKVKLYQFFKNRISRPSGWKMSKLASTYLKNLDSSMLKDRNSRVRCVAMYLLLSRFRNPGDTIDIVVDDPGTFEKRAYNVQYNRPYKFEFFAFPETLFMVSKQHFSYSIGRHEIDLMRNFYENLRLAYQPIVAKLAMLEKKVLHGINFSDLQESDNEMYFLLKPMPSLERGLLLSEYLNRVGDILFFKNGLVPFTVISIYDEMDGKGNCANISFNDDIFGANSTPYIKNVRVNKLHMLDLFGISNVLDANQFFNAPFSAFEYYFRSLLSISCCYGQNKSGVNVDQPHLKFKRQVSKVLYRKFFDKKGCYEDEEKNVLKELLETIVIGVFSVKSQLGRDDILNSVAAALADLGDSYYSMATINDNLPTSDYLNYFDLSTEPLINLHHSSGQFLGDKWDSLIEQDKQKINNIFEHPNFNDKLHKTVLYYFLSYLFLQKAGNYRSSSDKLTRILTIYAECHSKDKLNLLNGRNELYDSLKKIYFKASLLIHKSYDNTIRPEKLRYAYLTNVFYTQGWHEGSMDAYNEVSFENDTNKYLDRLYLKHSSINAYLKDLYIIMAKIVLDLDLVDRIYLPDDKAENLYRMKRQLINPFVTNSSNFTRVFELTLAIRINFQIAVAQGHLIKQTVGYDTSVYSVEEAIALSKVCIDSIYCTNAILEITYLSGHSYLVFNTITATSHKWFGDWCRWLKGCLRYLESVNETERLKEILYNLKVELNERKRLDTFTGGGESETCSSLDVYILDSSYQYEKSAERFNLAIQTHGEGKEYKNFIRGLYYLEDDFNDELIHFYAARERFMINCGAIGRHLKEIDFHLRNSETNSMDVILKDYLMGL